MPKIIINADDFGLKSSINKAIVEAFHYGLINSTTLMANMPGFDEAVELAHKHHINDRIGIHLNLDEGHFITSDMYTVNNFDDNNMYFRKNRFTLFFLSNYEKKLIYKEFEAQIEKITKEGIKITHIDTHHHIHEIWPITNIILALLKKHNISSMRILNNLNTNTRFYKFYYREFLNKRIRKNIANFSDLFGNQLEASLLLKKYPDVLSYKQIEVMVHPDYNDIGVIIDRIKNQEFRFEFSENFIKNISIKS